MSLKKHAKSFYFASFFLSSTTAKHASNLYQVCRLLDDIVDHHLHPNPIQALDTISTYIKTTSQNKAVFISKDNYVNKEALLGLIQGIQSDAVFTPYHTLEELLGYCYQVAGTVGIMMCDILEVKDPKAYKHAVDLGVAMQLTNICRDVYKDAQLGRVYIPTNYIGSVSSQDILNPNSKLTTDIATTIIKLLELADKSYQSGYYGLSYIPRSNRLAIYIAGKLYQSIKSALQPDNIRHAAYIAWHQKISIALGATMRFYHNPMHLYDCDNTPESCCSKYALADV